MSNLFKSFLLVPDEDNKRIIDSNEAISAKLEEIRKIVVESDTNQDGFSLGLNPENVEELLEEGGFSDSNVYREAETGSVDNANIRAEAILEEARSQAERILKEAEEDADRIIGDAKNQANAIMDDAYAKGIAEGREQGAGSLAEEKAQMEEKLKLEEKMLQEEFEKKSKEIESELIDVMMDVFGSVTKVLAEEHKDMIVTLIDKVISGNEASGSYIIKACKEDAQFLRDNRENILKKINRNVHLEIVEDISMKRNECLIDTDLGIYDCSLDIQLENLIKSIKILSCMD